MKKDEQFMFQFTNLFHRYSRNVSQFHESTIFYKQITYFSQLQGRIAAYEVFQIKLHQYHLFAGEPNPAFDIKYLYF